MTKTTPSTTFYKHYLKKEEDYIILDTCLLQNPQGVWCEAIFYKGVKSGKKFCRFEDEFESKFSVKE